jgi:hypothetical protein
MKKKVAYLALCLFFAMVTYALSEDKFAIKFAFAFKDRFQAGSQQIGFPEGNVLQVGCFIKSAGSPIREVTVKNLDTGLVLTASPVNVGNIWSGIYMVSPEPAFDPSKHMGVWEIRVKDEKGNEATARTHKLNIKGEMPYVEGLKASGNPLAPTITWTALSEKDIPQGCAVKYQVRLLKDDSNQFYKSKALTDTTLQIPEGPIKPEELSKIYIRVDTQGWDKNDKEHPLPLELKSQTFKPLNEALGKR